MSDVVSVFKTSKVITIFKDTDRELLGDIKVDGRIFLHIKHLHSETLKMSHNDYKYYLLILMEVKDKLRALGYKKIYTMVTEKEFNFAIMMGFNFSNGYEDVEGKKYFVMEQET